MGRNDEIDNPSTIMEVARSKALTLLVMSPAGTMNVPVPDRGTVVLGRGRDCDVPIDDVRLSRRHAQLSWGERVEIVDLGSLNGSFVREQRLEPHVPVVIGVGDSVTIGATILVLQRGARAERPRHVWTHEYLEARLEEECARAARDGTDFAVIRLRLSELQATTSTKEGATVPSVLALWLRDTDVLARYALHEYEILLPGAPADEADARAAELSKELAKLRQVFELHVAAYPRDGRTPEALVEHTTRALARGAGSTVTEAERTSVPNGAIERMDPIIARVAAGTINVLILGETGVGKEVLARRIHERSPRAAMPIVSLNCAALSESLLESELFGHEKGAFTGATAAKAGLLESAAGGTFFMDEVGEMPLTTQAKLLRVLEQREVTRVGALRPRPIDVRFLAATNRDLEAEIAAGRFRQDLYFRLNGITLSLPPLRERVEEIEPLARFFLEQAAGPIGRRATIAPEALTLLEQYPWPGNIRELRNVIERAVTLSSTGDVLREHLPVEKMSSPMILPSRAPALVPGFATAATLPPTRPPLPTLPNAAAWDAVTDHGAPLPLPATSTDDEERRRLVDALEKCGGNQSQAAKMLGVSRQTIIRRIAEYELPRPRKRE